MTAFVLINPLNHMEVLLNEILNSGLYVIYKDSDD